MLGPVTGGLIVSALNWRFIFFVNIPIGLAGLYLIGRYLPDYRDESRRRFDTAGFVLFGGGIALLSYVLEVFGDHTLGAFAVGALLAASIILLAAYACIPPVPQTLSCRCPFSGYGPSRQQ